MPNSRMARSLTLPISLSLLTAFATLPAASATDDALEKVLERHLAAITTQAEGAEYATLTGRGVYTEKFDDQEVPFLVEQQDDKFRFVVVSSSNDFLYSLSTGKRSFQRDPETFEWMELDKSSVSRDLRIFSGGLDLARKSFRKGLELGESDDPRTVVLHKTYRNGDTAVITLNADTMLLEKIAETRKTAGRTLFVTREYDDYRTVEGKTVPFVITEWALGGWRKFSLNEFVFDRELPEGAFDLPAELESNNVEGTR